MKSKDFDRGGFVSYQQVLSREPQHTGANLNIGNLLMYGGYQRIAEVSQTRLGESER